LKQQLSISYCFAVFFLLRLSVPAHAQDFIDIVKFNTAQTIPLQDTSAPSTFATASIFIPLVYNKEKGNAITVGINTNHFHINAAEGKDYRFHNLTLPVGWHWNASEKWIVDITLLNRWNGDFAPLRSKDYQLGILSSFGYKKSETFTLKFGLYANRELSGPLLVPLVGVNWKINDKWQVYGMLPIEANAFYRASTHWAFGASFRGQVATYALNSGTNYVQRGKNELGLFGAFYLTPTLVLEAKAGYLIGSNYKEYLSGDEVDWALSLVRFGDDRVPLNTENGDGFFGKISFLYRFDLNEL